MDNNEWRTDEPEVGTVAKITGHGRLCECIEIGPGQKAWTNHAGYIREILPFVYRWQPITTPEERRLRAEVERLREENGKLKDVSKTCVEFLSGGRGCGTKHTALTFQEFMDAGGNGCPLCLTKEVERLREAIKTFAVHGRTRQLDKWAEEVLAGLTPKKP